MTFIKYILIFKYLNNSNKIQFISTSNIINIHSIHVNLQTYSDMQSSDILSTIDTCFSVLCTIWSILCTRGIAHLSYFIKISYISKVDSKGTIQRISKKIFFLHRVRFYIEICK